MGRSASGTSTSPAIRIRPACSTGATSRIRSSRRSAAAVSHAADLAGYNLLGRLTVSADGRPPRGHVRHAGLRQLLQGRPAAARARPWVDRRRRRPGRRAGGRDQPRVVDASLRQRAGRARPDRAGQRHGLAIVGVTAARYRGLSQGGFLPPTDVTVAMANQPLVSPEWIERGQLALRGAEDVLGARDRAHDRSHGRGHA